MTGLDDVDSRITFTDGIIASRHAMFLKALSEGELAVAEFWHDQRDSALERRYELQNAHQIAAVVKA